MDQYILDMQDVIVRRDRRRQILKLKHFCLRPGEMVAVVGPNGAGKSTLLQTIQLLHDFTGHINLFGVNVRQADHTMLRRRLSMVFQDTLLLEETVFNNLALGLKFRGLSATEIEHRVHQTAAQFQCEHLLRRPARNLSGGEVQRVGIARSMATLPQLLLLDEPFAALDLAVRREMIDRIKQQARQNSMTVILVSHDFAEALYFADRAVALFGGTIIQDDTTENLWRHPVNKALASLVGMDNMLTCRAERVGEYWMVKLDGGVNFLCEKELDANISACCIPGDCLFLDEAGRKGKDGRFVVITAEVSEIRPDVGNYQVVVRFAGQILRARVPRHLTAGLREHSELQLAFPVKEVHLL